MALEYFVLNRFKFKNDNFGMLSKGLKLEDDKAFTFHESFQFDVILYLRYALVGCKRYLLGDIEDHLPRNRRIFRRMWWIDRCLKSIPYGVAFYYFFVKYELIQVCKSFFSSF